MGAGLVEPVQDATETVEERQGPTEPEETDVPLHVIL